MYALYRNTVYAFSFLSLGGCKTEVRIPFSSSLRSFLTAICPNANRAFDSEKRNPAIIPRQTQIIADNTLNFASQLQKNAKEKTQISYQYLSPLVAKYAYFDTRNGCTHE